MPVKAPTIRDVALEAGVSKSTVSLCLNNDPRTAEATREHVQKVAAKLGYRRDATLSGYMAYMGQKKADRRGQVIGMLSYMKDRAALEAHLYASAFHQHVRKQAESLGYGLDVFFMGPGNPGGRRLHRILQARGITGLIIAPTGRIEPPPEIIYKHYALALGQLTFEKPAFHRVEADSWQNTWLTLQEAYKLGYRRIGAILQGNYARITRHQCEAAISYFRDRHADVTIADPITMEDYDLQPWNNWIRESRPELLISNVMGAYNWLISLGYSVPEDIGYAQLSINPRIRGLDAGEPYIEHKYLSGIDVLPEVMDAASVDLLVGQLQRHEYGPPKHPRTLLIEGKWRRGKTLRRLKR